MLLFRGSTSLSSNNFIMKPRLINLSPDFYRSNKLTCFNILFLSDIDYSDTVIENILQKSCY